LPPDLEQQISCDHHRGGERNVLGVIEHGAVPDAAYGERERRQEPGARTADGTGGPPDRGDTADTGKHNPFNYVWKKHHITEDDYKKSLDFYTHNPNELDSIYENVLNDLSKQKAELLAKRHLNK